MNKAKRGLCRALVLSCMVSGNVSLGFGKANQMTAVRRCLASPACVPPGMKARKRANKACRSSIRLQGRSANEEVQYEA